MIGSQVDALCRDWIAQNCGAAMASKYTRYSLFTPLWNDPELNEALETLRQVLCISFGPDESFGTTDYHKARIKLRLSSDESQIPKAFLEVFAEKL